VKCWESYSPCRCHIAGSSESIDNIPSVYSSIDHEFKLLFCSITYLKNDSFISKGLKELKKLSLNRCGLEAIEIGAFYRLTKLTGLSLRHNELREIILRTFEKNSLLKYLHLSHNRSEHLKGNEVSGLLNLNYENLTSNKLRTIHPHFFVRLTYLIKIVLSNDPGLQIVIDRPFFNSTSLKILGISGCNISSVSFETFAKVSALEWLDLSYNYLRSVDIDIVKVLPNCPNCI